MDAEKNTTLETDATTTNEAGSFKAKREQWEAEWKAELKRDWEKSWKQDWKKEWKDEWKKHGKEWKNRRDSHAAVKLEINNQTYSLSVGKLIVGVILLTLLPFHWLLFGGALWAAYHFGRQSAQKNTDSDDSNNGQREEVTAA